MSLESVRSFFATHAPDIEIIETEQSSATVPLAALAHGVDPDQIAKTICLRAGDVMLLVVMSGNSRIDNKKFRSVFSAKPRMLASDEVMAATGHPIGGVCPFGLATELQVYCDLSLKDYPEVVPAAGATNAAIKIDPDRLAELTKTIWIDCASRTDSSAG
ncbi:YbaK/EbsC family protein [Neorhizobium sp. AL 9.2.2]|uniref:YbaK/EbsC family protein n=1 Tax=Neorhizobium sp. AL 9.2.2 TaxID=2712894 RepID=UPI001574A032|nr:YbaK/EbsC family protein [Neorhizobium sp. AL 9.2.2]NSY15821.1 YbaK/EbsC family protein [Neorhizobium sp. AL 9.2.2]